MMGQQADRETLFHEFSLERHVPVNHLLRAIDRFVDLGDLRSRLVPFYSSTGRPSIDRELLIRMLLVLLIARLVTLTCDDASQSTFQQVRCPLMRVKSVPAPRPRPLFRRLRPNTRNCR